MKLRAKKKYGQHFLVDQVAIDTIADTVLNCAGPIGKILEIGPGKGALTKGILSKENELKLVEIDQDMVNYLMSQLNIPAQQIIEDNVLSEEDKGFNQVVLYGRDVSIEEIIDYSKRFPMMSEKQVVIVKEAQELSRTIDKLISYVQNLNIT